MNTNDSPSTNDNKKQAATDQPDLSERIEQLESELKDAQETARRFRADYENLQKRTDKWKQRLIRLANRDFVEPLLEPLGHLRMAAKQLDDQGLTMVTNQLWNTLKEQGLERMDPEGESFDVETMEAVEQQGQGDTVLQVQQVGYMLNGEVIRHAKVVVGDLDAD